MQQALAISVVRPRRLSAVLAAVVFALLLIWAAATSGIGVSLAVATFISEDLTCITAGQHDYCVHARRSERARSSVVCIRAGNDDNVVVHRAATRSAVRVRRAVRTRARRR